MDLGTPGATKIAGAVGLLAVAALGWVVAVGPETSALGTARQQVADIRDQNALLSTQLTALTRQQQDLPETRRTARRLAERFPATADQPGLFEAVTAAAVDAGIGPQGVTALTPSPPVIGDGTAAAVPADATGTAPAPAGGNLARQTVTVSVTGTYDQTELLLENLEHMPRAYLVTSVALSGDPASGAFTTSITGDMFVMPPVQDPGRALAAASTGETTDPAGTTVPEE
jgi:Tfp pilus assembly protein PilO